MGFAIRCLAAYNTSDPYGLFELGFGARPSATASANDAILILALRGNRVQLCVALVHYLGTSSHGDNLADVAGHFPIHRGLLSFMTLSSYLTALGIFTGNWFSSPGIILARSVR